MAECIDLECLMCSWFRIIFSLRSYFANRLQKLRKFSIRLNVVFFLTNIKTTKKSKIKSEVGFITTSIMTIDTDFKSV